MTTRVQQDHCPWCGEALDSFSGFAPAGTATGPDEAPREGDLTVCIECGEILGITAERRLRKVESEELASLVASHPTELGNILKVSHVIKERRGEAKN